MSYAVKSDFKNTSNLDRAMQDTAMDQRGGRVAGIKQQKQLEMCNTRYDRLVFTKKFYYIVLHYIIISDNNIFLS